MANQLQLQRQIQEEIDREAKIDRLIESKLRRFLKRTKNLKQVYRQEDCDAIMIFDRDDLTSVHTFYIDDPKEKIDFPDRTTIFYFKNKNKHDSKLHQYSYILKKLPYKRSKHNRRL